MSEISSMKHQVNLAKWTSIIQACQSSGMHVTEWCKTNDVNIKSYYYWLRKVREKAISNLPAEVKSSLAKVEENSPVSFRKLEVQSPVSDMAPAVIIRLPYASLEISNDASQRTVEAVLLALKSTC